MGRTGRNARAKNRPGQAGSSGTSHNGGGGARAENHGSTRHVVGGERDGEQHGSAVAATVSPSGLTEGSNSAMCGNGNGNSNDNSNGNGNGSTSGNGNGASSLAEGGAPGAADQKPQQRGTTIVPADANGRAGPTLTVNTEETTDRPSLFTDISFSPAGVSSLYGRLQDFGYERFHIPLYASQVSAEYPAYVMEPEARFVQALEMRFDGLFFFLTSMHSSKAVVTFYRILCLLVWFLAPFLRHDRYVARGASPVLFYTLVVLLRQLTVAERDRDWNLTAGFCVLREGTFSVINERDNVNRMGRSLSSLPPGATGFTSDGFTYPAPAPGKCVVPVHGLYLGYFRKDAAFLFAPFGTVDIRESVDHSPKFLTGDPTALVKELRPGRLGSIKMPPGVSAMSAEGTEYFRQLLRTKFEYLPPTSPPKTALPGPFVFYSRYSKWAFQAEAILYTLSIHALLPAPVVYLLVTGTFLFLSAMWVGLTLQQMSVCVAVGGLYPLLWGKSFLHITESVHRFSGEDQLLPRLCTSYSAGLILACIAASFPQNARQRAACLSWLCKVAKYPSKALARSRLCPEVLRNLLDFVCHLASAVVNDVLTFDACVLVLFWFTVVMVERVYRFPLTSVYALVSMALMVKDRGFSMTRRRRLEESILVAVLFAAVQLLLCLTRIPLHTMHVLSSVMRVALVVKYIAAHHCGPHSPNGFRDMTANKVLCATGHTAMDYPMTQHPLKQKNAQLREEMYPDHEYTFLYAAFGVLLLFVEFWYYPRESYPYIPSYRHDDHRPQVFWQLPTAGALEMRTAVYSITSTVEALFNSQFVTALPVTFFLPFLASTVLVGPLWKVNNDYDALAHGDLVYTFTQPIVSLYDWLRGCDSACCTGDDSSSSTSTSPAAVPKESAWIKLRGHITTFGAGVAREIAAWAAALRSQAADSRTSTTAAPVANGKKANSQPHGAVSGEVDKTPSESSLTSPQDARGKFPASQPSNKQSDEASGFIEDQDTSSSAPTPPPQHQQQRPAKREAKKAKRAKVPVPPAPKCARKAAGPPTPAPDSDGASRGEEEATQDEEGAEHTEQAYQEEEVEGGAGLVEEVEGDTEADSSPVEDAAEDSEAEEAEAQDAAAEEEEADDEEVMGGDTQCTAVREDDHGEETAAAQDDEKGAEQEEQEEQEEQATAHVSLDAQEEDATPTELRDTAVGAKTRARGTSEEKGRRDKPKEEEKEKGEEVTAKEKGKTRAEARREEAATKVPLKAEAPRQTKPSPPVSTTTAPPPPPPRKAMPQPPQRQLPSQVSLARPPAQPEKPKASVTGAPSVVVPQPRSATQTNRAAGAKEGGDSRTAPLSTNRRAGKEDSFSASDGTGNGDSGSFTSSTTAAAAATAHTESRKGGKIPAGKTDARDANSSDGSAPAGNVPAVERLFAAFGKQVPKNPSHQASGPQAQPPTPPTRVLQSRSHGVSYQEQQHELQPTTSLSQAYPPLPAGAPWREEQQQQQQSKAEERRATNASVQSSNSVPTGQPWRQLQSEPTSRQQQHQQHQPVYGVPQRMEGTGMAVPADTCLTAALSHCDSESDEASLSAEASNFLNLTNLLQRISMVDDDEEPQPSPPAHGPQGTMDTSSAAKPAPFLHPPDLSRLAVTPRETATSWHVHGSEKIAPAQRPLPTATDCNDNDDDGVIFDFDTGKLCGRKHGGKKGRPVAATPTSSNKQCELVDSSSPGFVTMSSSGPSPHSATSATDCAAAANTGMPGYTSSTSSPQHGHTRIGTPPQSAGGVPFSPSGQPTLLAGIFPQQATGGAGLFLPEGIPDFGSRQQMQQQQQEYHEQTHQHILQAFEQQQRAQQQQQQMAGMAVPVPVHPSQTQVQPMYAMMPPLPPSPPQTMTQVPMAGPTMAGPTMGVTAAVGGNTQSLPVVGVVGMDINGAAAQRTPMVLVQLPDGRIGAMPISSLSAQQQQQQMRQGQ